MYYCCSFYNYEPPAVVCWQWGAAVGNLWRFIDFTNYQEVSQDFVLNCVKLRSKKKKFKTEKLVTGIVQVLLAKPRQLTLQKQPNAAIGGIERRTKNQNAH